MVKKVHVVFFVAALAAMMVFSGVLNREAMAGELLDIGEAAWAEQEIMEMSSLGIINGYPDGRFLPYQSVTRLESIAMLIRMLGLDEQARALDKAQVNYQIPYVDWGRGYLIMGVNEGMLDKNYLTQLEPNGAATRAQVAALVCLALDLESTGSSLNFADTAQIPAGYRDYVATLVDKKIMQGLPGNVFEPNSVINRAQMAVLLSNLLNKGFANPFPERYITGTVSNIEPISGVIALKEGKTAFLTAGCRYYLDGKKAAASDIKVGDAVKLILDDNGHVIFIRAERSGQAGESQLYRGRVDNVLMFGGECWVMITCLDGTKLTRLAPSDITVSGPGGQSSLAGLSAGKYIELALKDDKISKITILNTKTVKGRVLDIEPSTLTIISNGSRTELDIPAGVAILKDGKAVSYSKIAVNNEVEVTIYDDEAIQIIILKSTYIEGEIEELDKYDITVRDTEGYRRTYELADDVDVIIDGESERLSDLKEGDQVRLQLDSNNYVLSIELLEAGASKLEGEIYDLDTSGTYGITIRNANRDKYTYKVEKDVYVYDDDDRELDFDELKTGYKVRLELNRDGWVDEIEVLKGKQSTEEGVISGLRTGSRPRLWFINDDGDEVRYDISDDVEITRDGDTIDLKDIVIGSEAEIEIEDDEVVAIEITDDEDITIEGEIIDVRVSSDRIKIEQDSGNQFTYYLDDNAVLRDRDGDRIDLEDVEEGWDVELRLRDGMIYRLTEL